MRHKAHALSLIRQRLGTNHADLPNAGRLAEKLDSILPVLQVFEAPRNYVDPRAKAGDYETAKELHLRVNHCLADLKDGQQNNVSNVIMQILNSVVSDANDYLEKHHADA